MSRDDQLKQALDGISRLARDTWQHKDGRVIIDTPAHHVLVKDVDQFGRMLARRGYCMEEDKDEYGPLYRVKIDGGEHITEYSFRVDGLLYRTVFDVAEEIDKIFAQGWKHMACIQCGTPLLVSFKWLHETGVALKWYGVCSVQAGPHSKHLEECSGCGLEFSYPPPLRGIDDIGEEEARNAD